MPLPIVIHRYRSFFGDYLPWYSIAVGVALGAMAIGLYMELRKQSKDQESLFLLCFPLSLIFGVLVAACFDAVFRGTWRTWFGNGEKQFGFVFLGWAIGVLLFVSAWGRATRLGAKYLFDFYAPLLAIAQSIGRIGCFLGGCCYGVPSKFLGVHYPEGSLPHNNCGDIALFPIQLVESVWLLGIFVVCVSIKRKFAGAAYLIGVSAGRIFFEYFRYDNRGEVAGISCLSPSQMLSILLLISGFLLLLFSASSIKASREGV